MSSLNGLLSNPIVLFTTIFIGVSSIYWTFKAYKQHRHKQEFESLVDYFKIHRKFVESNKTNKRNKDDVIVRAMSYNILAPDPSGIEGTGYALSKQHDYCPRKYRLWDYRLPRIMAQIIAYSPDIVCMQETTTHSFNNSLESEFNKLDYEGWHQRRSLTIVKATEAIFWKKNKFECLSKKLLRFNEIVEKYVCKKHENNKFYNKLKSRGDIC
eukprot:225530_1